MFVEKGGGGVIERVRLASWVLAIAVTPAAITAGAAGCSSNNNQAAGSGGPGVGGSTGHGGSGTPSVGRGSGGNGVGGNGVSGAAGSSAGGAAGTAAGGATGTSVGAAGSSAGGAAGTSAGGAGGSGVGGAAGAGTAGAGGGVVGGTTGTGGQPACAPPTGPAGSWVEVTPPPGQDGFRVTDAFAVGPNDLLFAGSTNDPTSVTAPSNARVLRWSQASQGCWTVEVTIPASASSPDVVSVHGTGPNDLWAAGSDLLYHRDAQGWTRFADESWRGTIRLPPFSPTQSVPVQLKRVRAAAAGDIWVAATSNVMHWNGQWTTYNFDDPTYPNAGASVGYDFADIWIDAPNNVWVVGNIDQVGNTMEPGGTHHFDGANWTHVPVGVFAIYAIWHGGSVFWLGQPPRLLAFTGTSNATETPIAGVDPTQRSVAITSFFGHGAGDIWGAGDDVVHFDGTGWSLAQDAPAAAHPANSDLRNTVVTGDAGSVWLATPGPHFFRRVTGP
jgi:hypothetical protein